MISAKNLQVHDVVRSMRRTVSETFSIDIGAIVFVKPASLPRTTSGKLQRLRGRELYQENAFDQIASWQRKDNSIVLYGKRLIDFIANEQDIDKKSLIDTSLAEVSIAKIAERPTVCQHALNHRGELELRCVIENFAVLTDAQRADITEMIFRQDELSALPYGVRIDSLENTAAGAEERHQTKTDKKCESVVIEEPSKETVAFIRDTTAKLLSYDESQIREDDHFFELGGDSIAAMRLAAEIERKIDRTIDTQIIFESNSLYMLALAVDKLTIETNNHGKQITCRPTRSEGCLTSQQKRLWFVEQLEAQANAAHHTGISYNIRGVLDVDVLVSAIQDTFQQHEILRTYFIEDPDGDVRAQLKTDHSFECRVTDASVCKGIGIDALTRAFLKEPFDLHEGQVCRANIILCGDNEYRLVLSAHHIVIDGWSINLLINEITERYHSYSNGNIYSNRGHEFQYYDYAQWLSCDSQSQDKMAESIKWWKKELENLPEVLNLPTDHIRLPEADYIGDYVAFEIEPDLFSKIKIFCKHHSLTVFSLLEGLYALMLAQVV